MAFGCPSSARFPVVAIIGEVLFGNIATKLFANIFRLGLVQKCVEPVFAVPGLKAAGNG